MLNHDTNGNWTKTFPEYTVREYCPFRPMSLSMHTAPDSKIQLGPTASCGDSLENLLQLLVSGFGFIYTEGGGGRDDCKV